MTSNPSACFGVKGSEFLSAAPWHEEVSLSWVEALEQFYSGHAWARLRQRVDAHSFFEERVYREFLPLSRDVLGSGLRQLGPSREALLKRNLGEGIAYALSCLGLRLKQREGKMQIEERKRGWFGSGPVFNAIVQKFKAAKQENASVEEVFTRIIVCCDVCGWTAEAQSLRALLEKSGLPMCTSSCAAPQDGIN